MVSHKTTAEAAGDLASLQKMKHKFLLSEGHSTINKMEKFP
jgi:hypothetical protein